MATSTMKRWFVHRLSETGLYSDEFLRKLTDDLGTQLKERAGIDIARSDFALHPREDAPRYTAENVGYIDGDLVGPDVYGRFVRIVWHAQRPTTENITLDDIEVLDPSSGTCFVWQTLPVDELRVAYVDAEPDHVPAIEGVTVPVEWSAWWNSTLPDIVFHLFTAKALSDEDCDEIDQALWRKVVENAISRVDTIQQQERHEPGTLDAKSAAEQGFANYASKVARESELHYYITVDFLSDYLNDEVFACWLHALDQIQDMAAIRLVRVG